MHLFGKYSLPLRAKRHGGKENDEERVRVTASRGTRERGRKREDERVENGRAM